MVKTNKESNDTKTDWVIGYGSLIHRGSLGKTIGGTASTLQLHPVWVDGLKRVYSLPPRQWWTRIPSQRIRFGFTERAAAATVETSGERINALLIPVNESQLRALDRREGISYGRYRRVFAYVVCRL